MSEPERKPMAASLDLAGDGDELDLVVGIEQAFDVELDEEARRWMTLGDIADWLETKTAGRLSGGKCSSAMAFWRLRAALGDRRLSPATKLADCLRGEPGAEMKRLGASCGLRLPPARLAALGTLGVWLLLAALPSLLGLLVGLPVWVPAILALSGFILLRLDRGRYPVETLGELATAAARLNHGRLAEAGARLDRETIWRTLVWLAEHHADAKPGTVGRATRIIA